MLTVSSHLLEQRLKFQLAHTIGLRILDESAELVRELVSKHPPRDDAGAKLYKIHLANYFAGALLLPYEDFFREVQRTRYDVERIADLFDVSYETVAHRCTNLADPRRRGLPMHFLRSDIGGNISKRYAATGIRFPNGTGSCPRWAVHMAFLTPSVLTRQYSIFPDGSTYFCFAKVIVHAHEGSVMKGTAYSIGLGTHADAARHLAYADDMPVSSPRDLSRMAVPTGVSCRFCERADLRAASRAEPQVRLQRRPVHQEGQRVLAARLGKAAPGLRGRSLPRRSEQVGFAVSSRRCGRAGSSLPGRGWPRPCRRARTC